MSLKQLYVIEFYSCLVMILSLVFRSQSSPVATNPKPFVDTFAR